VVAGVLLVGWLFLFTRPRTVERMVELEQAGWFTAAGYKSNQGQRVRRATVLGILALVVAGIYTMMSHNVLARTSPNWSLNMPFSGRVGIDSFGDTQQFIAALPADQKHDVRIVWPGASIFYAGQTVSFQSYREAVESTLKDKDIPGLSEDARDKDVEPTSFLLAVTKNVIAPTMQKVISRRAFGESVSRRLAGLYNQTPYEGLGELMPVFENEANIAKKPDLLQPQWDLPVAVIVVDRYVLRGLNDMTSESQYVKIVLPGDGEFESAKGKVEKFKEGMVVSRADFDKSVDRLEELKKQGKDRVLPKMGPLTPASGATTYTSFIVLPSVQYTVPLLLLAVSLWLAWRIVNMPTFADFLIATEAEMNKVSWTTQRRLIQDTIVVLVTVVLMALFLFGMDYTWKIVLSWKPIGVLHIPKDTAQKNKSVEQKRW
jgi:preprotein translocase SecE subunit